MEQPLGFAAQGEKHKVCKLKKAIYGLKRSPQTWFDKLSQILIAFGFCRSNVDHSIPVKKTSTCIGVLIIYVNAIYSV